MHIRHRYRSKIYNINSLNIHLTCMRISNTFSNIQNGKKGSKVESMVCHRLFVLIDMFRNMFSIIKSIWLLPPFYIWIHCEFIVGMQSIDSMSYIVRINNKQSTSRFLFSIAWSKIIQLLLSFSSFKTMTFFQFSMGSAQRPILTNPKFEFLCLLLPK